VLNLSKVVLLLSLLAGILIVLGDALAGRAGAIGGLLLALWLVVGLWLCSDRIALRAVGARRLGLREAPPLHAMLGDLAKHAQLPCPELYLSPHPQPNVFATGRNPNHTVIVVTQGLIDLVPAHEVRAVLAHELGHVGDRDTLVTSIAGAVVTGLAAIVSFASFGLLAVEGDKDDETAPLRTTLALLAVAPLAAPLLHLLLLRTRTYEADRTSVQLVEGDGEALAQALFRIDAHAHGQPMYLSPGQAQAWIVDPTVGLGTAARLFSTYPHFTKRIARIRYRLAHS
jgi:heat shock protein HtpX